MATISYNCDTCKRQIEILEQPQGFTVVGKCVITEGCIGRLYRTARNPNNVRESAPNYVEGLNNFVPRRAFFEFQQTISTDKWTVNHNMGVLPSIFVYVLDNNNEYVLLDNEEYTINPTSKNSLYLKFDNRVKGIVQCVAKSTIPMVPPTIVPIADQFRASAEGILTFAIPKFLTYADGTPPWIS